MKLRISRAYRHEIRHTFTSRATIAIAILTALAGISVFVNVDSVTNSFPIGGSAVFYYANGAYHVSGWAFDAGGARVSGVVAQFTETTFGNVTTTAGPYSTRTDGQGEFSLTVPVADNASAYLALDSVSLDSSRSVKVSWGGIFSVDGNVYLGFVPVGSVGGSNSLFTVGTDFYSAHSQVMVFIEGPNGTAPEGFRVETCSVANNFFFPPITNCSELPTQELGPVTGYWTHFVLPSYPANASNAFVQVVNSAGEIVESTTLITTETTENTSTVVNNAPGGGLLNAFAAEGSLFFAGMALVVCVLGVRSAPLIRDG